MTRTPGDATRRPVVVDTDGGVDDAVALWYVLRDPALDVLAVTVVWGNVGLATAAASVCRVLHAAGRDDVPVALGRATPFGAAPHLRPADLIHGADGLGNTHRPLAPFGPIELSAVDVLARSIGERPGEVAVLTLGPLSNVADFVTEHPHLVPAVDEIVVMGGAAVAPGNATPLGEANIAHDPAAAAAVVGAPWARPGLLVGLDVTRRATFVDDDFALLAEHRNPAAAFLDEPMRYYRRATSPVSGPGECACHDLLAAMTVVHGDLVDAPLLPLAIDVSGGAAWGATVVDLRKPVFAFADLATPPVDSSFAPWRIALEVDVDRYRRIARALFGAAV